jgi:hypothetical protein
MVAALTFKTFVFHDRVEVKVSMTLHRIDQHRDQRLQPLAANPIGGLPQHRQRLPHSLVVQTIAGPLLLRGDLLSKYSNGVFAVVSREGHELVEDLDLVSYRCVLVAHPHRLDQLLACCHADSPRHVVLAPAGPSDG